MPKESNATAELPAALTKLAAATKAALEEVHPQLYVFYREGVDKENMEKHAVIRGRYDRGVLLCKAEELKKSGNALGEMGKYALGDAWQLTRAQTRDLAAVAKKISEAEMSQFLALRDSTDQGLLWTHLLYLSQVADKAVRRDTMKKAAANKWSPAEMFAYMQDAGIQMLESGAREGAGRPHARPTTFRALVRDALKKANSYATYTETVVGATFHDLLEDTPPDKIDEDALQELATLADRYAEIAADAAARESEIRQAAEELASAREIALPAPTVTPQTIDVTPVAAPPVPPAMVPAADGPKRRGRPKKSAAPSVPKAAAPAAMPKKRVNPPGKRRMRGLVPNTRRK